MSTIKGRRETFIKTSLFFLLWWFKEESLRSWSMIIYDSLWWSLTDGLCCIFLPQLFVLFTDYMPRAGECWHLDTSWEHITVNVISTLKTALSPHTSLVGAFSRCLKGHTQPQPSTPDLSGRVKKEHLTASVRVKQGCKEWVKWRVKRVPAIWNVSTEI